MASGDDPSITHLLHLHSEGDAEASGELARRVYDELHRVAAAALGRARGTSLAPTELVHEAWIRFAGQSATFEHRCQFFALAARIMHSVLVDQARARSAAKRGGDRRPITLFEDAGVVEESELDFLDLQNSLERLKAMDEDLYRLVELRFFSGLGHAEIAGLLGVSLSTVERRWRLARAWLRGELAREG